MSKTRLDEKLMQAALAAALESGETKESLEGALQRALSKALQKYLKSPLGQLSRMSPDEALQQAPELLKQHRSKPYKQALLSLIAKSSSDDALQLLLQAALQETTADLATELLVASTNPRKSQLLLSLLPEGVFRDRPRAPGKAKTKAPSEKEIARAFALWASCQIKEAMPILRAARKRAQYQEIASRSLLQLGDEEILWEWTKKARTESQFQEIANVILQKDPERSFHLAQHALSLIKEQDKRLLVESLMYFIIRSRDHIVSPLWFSWFLSFCEDGSLLFDAESLCIEMVDTLIFSSQERGLSSSELYSHLRHLVTKEQIEDRRRFWFHRCLVHIVEMKGHDTIFAGQGWTDYLYILSRPESPTDSEYNTREKAREQLFVRKDPRLIGLLFTELALPARKHSEQLTDLLSRLKDPRISPAVLARASQGKDFSLASALKILQAQGDKTIVPALLALSTSGKKITFDDEKELKKTLKLLQK
jgi:hypothetical protein